MALCYVQSSDCDVDKGPIGTKASKPTAGEPFLAIKKKCVRAHKAISFCEHLNHFSGFMAIARQQNFKMHVAL